MEKKISRDLEDPKGMEKYQNDLIDEFEPLIDDMRPIDYARRQGITEFKEGVYMENFKIIW